MRKLDIQKHIIDNNIVGSDKGTFTLLWDVYFESDKENEEKPTFADMEVEDEFLKTIRLLIELDKNIFDDDIVDDIYEEAEELLEDIEGLSIEDSSLDYLFKRGFVDFNHEKNFMLRMRFSFDTPFDTVIQNFDTIVNTSKAELVI